MPGFLFFIQLPLIQGGAFVGFYFMGFSDGRFLSGGTVGRVDPCLISVSAAPDCLTLQIIPQNTSLAPKNDHPDPDSLHNYICVDWDCLFPCAGAHPLSPGCSGFRL